MKRRIETLFAGGLLALAVIGATMAGPLEAGTGDNATAFISHLRQQAEQGDAAAQVALGFLYEIGHGVPQDYAQALVWYRRAAEQGDAAAQLTLGLMYEKGRGVPQDYAQAFAWYRKAAEQGDADAQFEISAMYFAGRGVPQDDAQAAIWLRKAADQGHADAQFEIGAMYFAGRGVSQDYVQAHVWFNLAASRAPTAETRDKAVKARDRLGHIMTPDQLAEAQRLAREWKPTK